MTATVVLAGLAALLGAGGLGGVLAVLFGRRKVHAEASAEQARADFTVGDAWSKFVQTQASEIEGLKRDRDRLQGLLEAAQSRIEVLTRQHNEALMWQAQVTTRDDVLRPQLEERGIRVPPIPVPPVMRSPQTRVGDPNPKEHS